VIEMNLGEGAGGIKCVATRGSGIGRHMGATDMGSNNMGASWAFDTKKKAGRLI
jgi:AP-3 complex subunit mu